jgi:hypothetical protein
MATNKFTARRAVVALAIACATVAAPMALASSAGAQPGNCAGSNTPGNNSVQCAPANVPSIGAPSEGALTNMNPGDASPESPVHNRH